MRWCILDYGSVRKVIRLKLFSFSAHYPDNADSRLRKIYFKKFQCHLGARKVADMKVSRTPVHLRILVPK